MNTPAHAVLNLVVLGRGRGPGHSLPIALGAVLPDLPMLWFYASEKLRGVPERVIWSVSYYDPGWQARIDVFNSLPLIAVAAVAASVARAPRALALCASMGLHVLFDLPFHHDDAHRHFYPLSDWRFESPVSYWDPRHHGAVFASFEAAAVLVGSAVLARRHGSLGVRILLGLVVALYAAYLAFALLVWSPDF